MCHLTCGHASRLIAMHIGESTRSLHSHRDLEPDNLRRAALEAHLLASASTSARCEDDSMSDQKHFVVTCKPPLAVCLQDAVHSLQHLGHNFTS
jgi:hypothetical protein